MPGSLRLGRRNRRRALVAVAVLVAIGAAGALYVRVRPGPGSTAGPPPVAPGPASGPSTGRAIGSLDPDTGIPLIPAGDVAILLPGPPAGVPVGLVHPGAHVDVLVDVDGRGTLRYSVKDATVLAVGGTVDTIYLALPRHDALDLAWISMDPLATAKVISLAVHAGS